MVATIERREFLALLAGAIGTWPVLASAQSNSKPSLIGFLSGSNDKNGMIYARYFLGGMREFGYVEGRDFQIIYSFSGGYQDRLDALAQQMVQRNPNVIIGSAVVAAVAARRATSTIPIVCPALADAVHLGLIKSGAHPGGNVTGIEPYVPGLPAKQLELARQILPSTKGVGVLADLKDPKIPPQVQELEEAGRALEVKVITAGANQPDDLKAAFQTLVSESVQVIIVLQSSMLLGNSGPIAEMAVAYRVPVIYGYREHVIAGGLISYGVDLQWCFSRGAYFVDKILHGSTAGDLPVEFPTKLLLSMNPKAAKAIGFVMPEAIVLRADEIIE